MEALGMQDHHEAYNNMLQMNGLGLVHHINGTQPPQVELNGSSNQQMVENHRNGNATSTQHLNASTQNNSSTGIFNNI